MSNRDRIAHLRAEADAAAKEKAERAQSAPKSPKSPKASSRTRAAKPSGRVRFVWSVCGPSGKEVVRFPYAQEVEARAEAVRRTETSGQTHFVAKAEVPVE